MRKAILLSLTIIAIFLSGCVQPAEQLQANGGEEPPAEPPLITPIDFSRPAVIGALERKVFALTNEERQANYCQALSHEEEIDAGAWPVAAENIYTANISDFGMVATTDAAAAKIVEGMTADLKNRENILECGFEKSTVKAELNTRGDRITIMQDFVGTYKTVCLDADTKKCERSSNQYFAIVMDSFYCNPTHYATSFGVELKNRGTVAVPKDSIVKVLLGNEDSTYDYLAEPVEPGKKFWPARKSIVRTPPFDGRSFSLNTGTLGKELDMDYWVLYCAPGTASIQCGAETGRVIYSGNHLDCNGQINLEPYTGVIIEAET